MIRGGAEGAPLAMLPYWPLSAYYFFYFAFIGAFSPYFGLFLESRGFSAWDIGVLTSLMQAMRLLAPNLCGWLAERLGAKTPIVRVAALLSIAGFSGFLVAESFAGFLVSTALLAFFWSAALPLVEALTLAHLGGQANRYGAIRLWGSVGFIAAVLGLGWLLDRAPTSSTLWVSLALLGGILASALHLPERHEPGHARDRLPIADILRRPEVKALFAACFFMAAAHGALYVFFSIYLAAQGYSKFVIGLLWTLGVVAEIVVFALMPRLLRRFPARNILIVCFACAVVRFLAIGWGVDSLVLLVLAQLLHAATFGAYHATAMAVVGRWFAGHHQARGQALHGSISFGAGGMLGGVASGWGWEAIGAPLTFSLGAGFATAGLVLVWRLGQPSTDDPPAG